jgi:type I restriction enzyme R subunit
MELETEQGELFKTTLARFNRIYAFITQVCRLFDKDIHKFSVYAKDLLKFMPVDVKERVIIDDKIMLEYYCLEREFEGSISLDGNDEGFKPITGNAGRREKEKDPLSVIIQKINEKNGTEFTEMDKVLEQMSNDYNAKPEWHSYAENNDFNTFLMLLEKDFPKTAVERYEQNDNFFVRMFNDPDMMRDVVTSFAPILYNRLRESKRG